jgi:hypothetical protein
MALAGLWLASPCNAQSTTIRGQLLHAGQSPAAGVQVTLLSQSFGRSLPALTGNDGMYYFYNIPLGNYYLEVWTSNPPQAYPVQIWSYPYHDIPRLTVP